MAHVMVEKSFESPLTADDRNRLFGELGPCLEQVEARWIRSYLSRDGRRMVCQFEAKDAETLRFAHRVAGVPVVRVWTADVLTPDAPEPGRTPDRPSDAPAVRAPDDDIRSSQRE